MNRTINDLTATLAGALGAPHQLVEETARHFHEAGMLPDGDAPLDSEHCAILLIGVMRSPSPERSPEMVRLYGELPFERITRNETHAARRDCQGAIRPVGTWGHPESRDRGAMHLSRPPLVLLFEAVEQKMDGLDRQLWEIDENLMRAELGPAEMAEHTAKRANLPRKPPQPQVK